MAARPSPPRRTIVFATFGDEENDGDCLGSEFYAAHPPDGLPVEDVVYMELSSRDDGSTRLRAGCHRPRAGACPRTDQSAAAIASTMPPVPRVPPRSAVRAPVASAPSTAASTCAASSASPSE